MAATEAARGARRELDPALQRCDELEQQLAQARKEAAGARDALSSSQLARGRMEEERDGARREGDARICELRGDIERERERREALLRRVGGLEHAGAAAEQRCAALQTERDELRAALSSATQRRDAVAQKQRDEWDAERNQLRSEWALEREELQSVAKRAAECEARAAAAQSARESAEREGTEEGEARRRAEHRALELERRIAVDTAYRERGRHIVEDLLLRLAASEEAEERLRAAQRSAAQMSDQYQRSAAQLQLEAELACAERDAAVTALWRETVRSAVGAAVAESAEEGPPSLPRRSGAAAVAAAAAPRAPCDVIRTRCGHDGVRRLSSLAAVPARAR